MALTHLQALPEDTHNKTEDKDTKQIPHRPKIGCRTTSLSWVVGCGGEGDEQVDMAYIGLNTLTARRRRARGTSPSNIAAFCY